MKTPRRGSIVPIVALAAAIGTACVPVSPTKRGLPPASPGGDTSVAGVAKGTVKPQFLAPDTASTMSTSATRLLAVLSERPDFVPDAAPATARRLAVRARWIDGRIEVLGPPVRLKGDVFALPRVAARPAPDLHWLVIGDATGREIRDWYPLHDLARVRHEEVEGSRIVRSAVVDAREAILEIAVPDFAPAIYAFVSPAGEIVGERAAILVSASPEGP